MTIAPIRGLFEAHLTVSDLDRSIAFYRDVLGLPLAHRIPARQVAFFWVPSSDQACWACGPSAPRRCGCGCTSPSLSHLPHDLRIGGGAAPRRPHAALGRWQADRRTCRAVLDAGGERVFRRPRRPFAGVHLHAGRSAAAGAGTGLVVGLAEAGMSDELRIERRDGWRKLMLNRPDKLNAANEAMLHCVAALRWMRRRPTARCRALLLTGEGRGFCAGQELGASVMPGPDGPPDLGAVADLHHQRRAPAAGAADAGGVRGERRGGRRRRELCARLRHRAGRAQREVHPGLREDRPGAGFRRQLLPAAPDRRGARPRAGDARRSGGCRTGRGLGADLAGRWTMRRCSRRPKR